MANRVWQHLFGVGLVETPDDFGRTGQPPSNPALLDYLAGRLVDHGWSIKALVREIMLSRVYQLSSAHDERAQESDPANRLLWRMNRRRLDSDAIRDSLLQISGQLKLGRPAERVPPTQKDDRMKSFGVKEWVAAVANYRTVYQPVFREYVPPDWEIFDFPDPELVVGRRNVTTVPTQALYMLNSPTLVEASRLSAERLLKSSDLDDAAHIEQAYVLILNRRPSEEERREAAEFVSRFHVGEKSAGADQVTAWAALCQTLLASGEFRYLY
jgi:hypothetical protein